ncbi:MAG TPA: hypothetical protein ENJ37_06130 [Deltaproteobacteria bacterium]|nr:hypothetical protein [Deltaproteobacteria bacterium]
MVKRMVYAKRRRRPAAGALTALAGAAALLAASVLGPAAAEAGEVSHRVTKQLCAECHDTSRALAAKPYQHRPVELGKCTACHNPHASRHAGLLSEEGGRLCFNCHEQDEGFKGAVLHAPYASGRCLECHEAHVSDNAGLLKVAGGKGCYLCHKRDEIVAGANVHPEVKKDHCTACHNPHSSDNVGLLTADRNSVCARCHYKDGAPVIPCPYEVAGTDCLGCHSPHSSDRRAILRASLHDPFEKKDCAACHSGADGGEVRPGIAVCLKCHEKVMEGFNKLASHLMPAPGGGNACSNCHNPHGSDRMALLRDKESRICYRCHSDARQFVADSLYVHPDLEKCTECHASHGSNEPFLMARGAETCSSSRCHATQGTFTHPIGEDVIDPRSGGAMDCNTCHNPMGSPEETILRDEKDRGLCIQCHQV